MNNSVQETQQRQGGSQEGILIYLFVMCTPRISLSNDEFVVEMKLWSVGFSVGVV